MKVGPHSAGSDPGPACYGMGGTEPTVTDANLVLGYYDPGFFLGGRMTLDLRGRARRAVAVAEPLGLGIEEAALGIHKVVVESMAAAARVHLVEKGKDPRRYAMVGFGGAGPAHAVDVARVLGVVREVIMPPGLGRGLGAGLPRRAAVLRRRALARVEFNATGFDAAAVNALLAELEAEGRRAQLLAAGRRRRGHRGRAQRRHAPRRPDARHLRAAARRARIDAGLPAIRAAFAAAYAALHRGAEGARIEAINFRVRCAGRRRGCR